MICHSHSPRFEITLETSSIASSSRTFPARCAEVLTAADLEPAGGPYTLGNDGAVAEVGLEFPASPVESIGDSGAGRREDDSVIRDSEDVRSSDCARFCRERGFVLICSFNFDSRRESDPRLNEPSGSLLREGMPDP